MCTTSIPPKQLVIGIIAEVILLRYITQIPSIEVFYFNSRFKKKHFFKIPSSLFLKVENVVSFLDRKLSGFGDIRICAMLLHDL